MLLLAPDCRPNYLLHILASRPITPEISANVLRYDLFTGTFLSIQAGFLHSGAIMLAICSRGLLQLIWGLLGSTASCCPFGVFSCLPTSRLLWRIISLRAEYGQEILQDNDAAVLRFLRLYRR